MLSRRPRDEGMTLIEVLMVVLLIGIIMVPLGTAFVGFLRLSSQSSDRLAESQDAQIASFYFNNDVHALGVRDWSTFPFALQQSVELNVAAASGLYPCGSDRVALIRLAWDSPTSASGDPDVVRVSYWVETASSGQKELHRVTCIGSADVVEDQVVAHNVDSVGTPTCSTECTGAPPPATIWLDLVLQGGGGESASFTVTLEGQRRQT